MQSCVQFNKYSYSCMLSRTTLFLHCLLWSPLFRMYRFPIQPYVYYAKWRDKTTQTWRHSRKQMAVTTRFLVLSKHLLTSIVITKHADCLTDFLRKFDSIKKDRLNSDLILHSVPAARCLTRCAKLNRN